MVSINELPKDVFLFNPGNRAFIMGESDHLANTVTFHRVLRFALILIIFIVVPLTVVFYLFFLATNKSETLRNTVIAFGGMLVIVAYLVSLSYRQGRRMERKGQLVLGQVVKYDTRLAADTKGYKMGTRLHYQFETPQNQQIWGNRIVSLSPTHLKDGRTLPTPGTPLVILYLDDNWHSPL